MFLATIRAAIRLRTQEHKQKEKKTSRDETWGLD